MIYKSFDWVIGDDTEFPNKWPMEAEILNVQIAMNELIELCHYIGLHVLEAIEKLVTEARLNYYAPLFKGSLAETKGRRAWAHTDFGLIPLLIQDAAGGLEIEDRDRPGTFIPIIREDPTEITVYISDTMERLTNGFLRAALHQVAIPVGMNDDETGVLPERYSVASFVKASRDTFSGPLPHFVDFGHPAKILRDDSDSTPPKASEATLHRLSR